MKINQTTFTIKSVKDLPIGPEVLLLKLQAGILTHCANGYKTPNGGLVWPYIRIEPTHWTNLPVILSEV